MIDKIEEIQATFAKENLRFAGEELDTIIGTASNHAERFTIKGPVDGHELQRDHRFSFYGRWANYTNKRTGKTERQFHFKTVVPLKPIGRAGVIAYLIKAGQGRRIGPVTAAKIWESYGEESVEVVRTSPEIISEEFKVRIDYCESVANWLKSNAKKEQITIRLVELLDGRGFPQTLPSLALKKWGNKSVDVIKKNPFVLMEFRGVGFLKCDSLYLSIGLRPNRLRRQAYAAWYAITSDTTGNTWFHSKQIIKAIRSLIGSGSRPAAALKLAKRIGEMDGYQKGGLVFRREENGAIVDSGGELFVAEKKPAENESVISKRVSIANLRDCDPWLDVDEIRNITDHQKQALRDSLRGEVAILGGSPGTGKTYASALLIKRIADQIGIEKIAVAAPTGKAAVRISEAMAEHGVAITAKTWHSLLGVGSTGNNGGDWNFNRNENNPFEQSVIIGDESSMIDTDLMSSIFRAKSNATKLLFVGDVNQLPPVGHGAPLRDMIAAGVSYGELSKIMRNSGGIVETCAAIRDGNEWSADDNLEVKDYPEQIGSIFSELARAQIEEFDPVWDCQILVAVNDKSPLSRKRLNRILQDKLNPPKKNESPKSYFRPRDKIVCLKNGRHKISEQHKTDQEHSETYVANGELAEVVEVLATSILIKITSSGHEISIATGKQSTESSGCDFDLAYALSVHKSQGSEWPVALVVIDDYQGAKWVCDRSWLYTAISRAKKRCVLIGQKSTADAMCRKQTINNRKTYLRELILKTTIEIELAGI